VRTPANAVIYFGGNGNPSPMVSRPFDLPDAAPQKMTDNADKYPVERARDASRNYTDQ